MHFYSFNSFEKFLSRIHNIFLLLLPFPRYEGQKITMTIIFIFCISGLILIGVFVSLDSLLPIRFCQQVGLALIVPEIIGVKGTNTENDNFFLNILSPICVLFSPLNSFVKFLALGQVS